MDQQSPKGARLLGLDSLRVPVLSGRQRGKGQNHGSVDVHFFSGVFWAYAPHPYTRNRPGKRLTDSKDSGG